MECNLKMWRINDRIVQWTKLIRSLNLDNCTTKAISKNILAVYMNFIYKLWIVLFIEKSLIERESEREREYFAARPSSTKNAMLPYCGNWQHAVIHCEMCIEQSSRCVDKIFFSSLRSFAPVVCVCVCFARFPSWWRLNDVPYAFRLVHLQTVLNEFNIFGAL